MSVNPQSPGSGGGGGVGPQIAKLHDKIADDRRRIRALEGQMGGLSADSITGAHLAPASVAAEHIQTATINAGHVQAGSISAEHITANAINAGHISANSIQATHISAAAINTNHLTAGLITAQHIASQSIQTNHLTANLVTAQHIAAGTITATEIQAGSILATNIAAGQITAQHIVSGTISATHIAADSINATHITATTLQTLWTNAALITGSTIRGGRFVTSLSDTGSRIDIQSTGLKGYAASGAETFSISSGTGVFIAADPTSVIPGGALSQANIGGGNIVPNSSFEQGSQPGDVTDRRGEGWEVGGPSQAGTGPSTTQVFDGSNSYKLISAGNGTWLGRRDTGINRLKVRPGMKYTISAWVYASAARQVEVYHYSYSGTTDGYSGSLLQDHGPSTNVNGVPTYNAKQTLTVNGWTRVVSTVTTHASATHLGFLIHFPDAVNGDVLYVDAVQVEQGEGITNYSPKGDEILYSSIKSLFIGAGEIKANNIFAGAIQAQHISVQWGGKNLAQNSEFRLDPSVGGVVGVPQMGLYQGSSFLWETNGGNGINPNFGPRISAIATANPLQLLNDSERIVVKPGDKLVFSCYIFAGSSGTTMEFGPRVFNSSLNFIGQGGAVALDTASGSTIPVNGWMRIAYSYTVPALLSGSAPAYLGWVLSVSNPTVNSRYYMSNVQIERGEVLTAWAPKPDEILAGSVGPTLITPGSITTDQLSVANVQAGIITTNSITSTKIAAGAVTASKMVVGYVASNILSGYADVDFERTDSLSLKGWYTSGQHIGAGSNISRSTGFKFGGAASMNVNVTGTNQGTGVQFIPGPPETGGVWKAGVQYTASAYINASPNWTMGFLFGSDTVTDYNYTTFNTNVENNKRFTRTWTPSADRTTAMVMFRVDSGVANNFYIDDVQIEVGPEASPFSAAASGTVFGTRITPGGIETPHLKVGSVTADKITMQLPAQNRLKNSSFSLGGFGNIPEVWNYYSTGAGIASWSQMNGANTVAWPGYLELRNSTTVGRVGIQQSVGVMNDQAGGNRFSASAYCNTGAANIARIYIDWYNGGTFVGATSREFNIAANTWTFISTDQVDRLGASGPFVAPGGASSCVVYYWIENVPSLGYTYWCRTMMHAGEKAAAWAQGIDPTVIDGSSITSGLIRTNSTSTRVEIRDDTADNGLTVWNSGTKTLQIKGGAGGIDMLGSTVDTPETSRKIRFLNPGDLNSPMLEISAYDPNSGFNPSSGLITARARYAANGSFLKIGAAPFGTEYPSALIGFDGKSLSGTSSMIYAHVNGSAGLQSVGILDANGNSGFVKRHSGSNKLAVDWNGTVRIWIDGNHVITLNAPGPWPRVI